jgi:hypothetical protein
MLHMGLLPRSSTDYGKMGEDVQGLSGEGRWTSAVALRARRAAAAMASLSGVVLAVHCLFAGG